MQEWASGREVLAASTQFRQLPWPSLSIAVARVCYHVVNIYVDRNRLRSNVTPKYLITLVLVTPSGPKLKKTYQYWQYDACLGCVRNFTPGEISIKFSLQRIGSLLPVFSRSIYQNIISIITESCPSQVVQWLWPYTHWIKTMTLGTHAVNLDILLSPLTTIWHMGKPHFSGSGLQVSICWG